MKEKKQNKLRLLFSFVVHVHVISQTSAYWETYSQMDLHDHFDFNEAEFSHENCLKVILYFECYGNASCK